MYQDSKIIAFENIKYKITENFPFLQTHIPE